MEMRFYCKILRISYKDYVTNEEVRAKILQATGPLEDLPPTVSSHLSFNRGGPWGTTYDVTTSFLHFSLFSTALPFVGSV